jgi:hypothetical protein
MYAFPQFILEHETMTSRIAIGLVAILLIAIASALWVAPAATSSCPSQARARTASSNRQAIKQMPILERPTRAGHFYGNTVRRRYYRQTSGG